MLFSERRRRSAMQKIVDRVAREIMRANGPGATYVNEKFRAGDERLVEELVPETWHVVGIHNAQSDAPFAFVFGITAPATWHCYCTVMRYLIMGGMLKSSVDDIIGMSARVHADIIAQEACVLTMPGPEWFACTSLTAKEKRAMLDGERDGEVFSDEERAMLMLPDLPDPFEHAR